MVAQEEAQIPKNVKRRCWQFSLRTLLIFVTFLAVLFAWIGHRYRLARTQRAAVMEIQESGGSVFYDFEFTEQGQQPSSGISEWIRGVFGKDAFGKVVSVSFDTQVNENDARWATSETSCLGSLGHLPTASPPLAFPHTRPIIAV